MIMCNGWIVNGIDFSTVDKLVGGKSILVIVAVWWLRRVPKMKVNRGVQ